MGKAQRTVTGKSIISRANPEGFTVSDRIRELAQERGWPDPDQEIEAFLDYWIARNWKAKSGVRIVDKEAAFRTWLRNQAKWAKERGNGNASIPKGWNGLKSWSERRGK